jgi:hypothetical protein
MDLLGISLAFGAGVIVAVAIALILQWSRRRGAARSFSQALFLIRIPRERKPGEGGKDLKQEIGMTEQLFASLTSLKEPFVFEVCVPHVGEEIHFFMAVPRKWSETAVKQVQGLWPGAAVEPVGDDFNIFNPQGAAAAALVKLKQNDALPVRSYADIGADTFESIAGAFTKIQEVGEGAALQIVMRPAPAAKKRIQKQIESLKKGEPAKKVLGGGVAIGMGELGKALKPQSKEEKREEKADRVVDEDAVKALEEKIAKPLFAVNVRLVASGATPFQANDIVDGLAAGFSQLTAPLRNEFRIVKPRNPLKTVYDFSFRRFVAGDAITLSSEEIASFFHFPISATATPKVKWLKSKEAPPPSNLPQTGTLIGTSSYRGQMKPVYITEEDRRRHVYLIGQTGTGKSTQIGNMILDDIRKGKGLAVIDPHGDLVDGALRHIPRERIDDVIYFDPSDLERPVGLNMLDFNRNRPEEKTFIVNEMQGIFNKLFPPESMGPMFEQYMRNALLLLMEDLPNEPATLIEVPRVFTDAQYRLRKLERITNPVVIDFWSKEAAKAGGEASLANMTPYITSKFNNFIANDFMRPIIGQPRSAFNFRELMDSGKILLVNLTKGRLGDLNAGLLGMIFTGKILMAALSRTDIKDKAARRDFHLYIDEFQNFTTDSISSILSEARKYALTLTVAHQFIAQLTDPIRDAIFGNVGTQMVFRVGVQDAEFLVKQFDPVFDENDLMSIDNLNAYIRLLVNGETTRPFNIRTGTESWAPGNPEAAVKLREYIRLKYGADRQEVEQSIYQRLRT